MSKNLAQQQREQLVEQLKLEGITHPAVLDAILAVPREKFVRPSDESMAYANTALPLDCRQTISQPYVVARMTEALVTSGPLNKVLEIGTGSGYQAAVLAQIAEDVYTIERIETLYRQANLHFQQLNLNNIHTRYADGFLGWPEQAPYDGIIVTAAANEIPKTLVEQLNDGGRMIIPIGGYEYGQELQLITKHGNNIDIKYFDRVLFVPMLKGTEE